MLKLENKIIEKLNENIQKKSGATWKIDAKTLAIKINKQGVLELQGAGVNIENGYISRKSSAYNIMLDVLKNNSDVFTLITE